LAPNHGQKSWRGRPCRSASEMTLIPLISTPRAVGWTAGSSLIVAMAGIVPQRSAKLPVANCDRRAVSNCLTRRRARNATLQDESY
jgi:hypothetical protein